MTSIRSLQTYFNKPAINSMHILRGFSLVELMVAMTIGLVLLLVIGTVFVSSRQTFNEQENQARLQESGRFALEIIGRSVKQAGHVEIPFSGFKAEFEGTVINGTNGSGNAADTITLQFEGTLGDSDCETTDVTVAGEVIQNHFSIDVANAELQCDGNLPNAPGVPSTGRALLSNVEDLQVSYGIDTNTDQSVDQYVDLPGDWEQVITARICVLVRSEKTNIVTVGNYLDCNGNSVAIPADRRLRRTFTATFNLRNRINSML
ncbi:type IV pilus assembly protein PilW [Nitrosomonas sp. PY1]|nr:type IV pilus assembly protein PilW [Nitrosomonas sp. PY1]